MKSRKTMFLAVGLWMVTVLLNQRLHAESRYFSADLYGPGITWGTPGYTVDITHAVGYDPVWYSGHTLKAIQELAGQGTAWASVLLEHPFTVSTAGEYLLSGTSRGWWWIVVTYDNDPWAPDHPWGQARAVAEAAILDTTGTEMGGWRDELVATLSYNVFTLDPMAESFSVPLSLAPGDYVFAQYLKVEVRSNALLVVCDFLTPEPVPLLALGSGLAGLFATVSCARRTRRTRSEESSTTLL